MDLVGLSTYVVLDSMMAAMSSYHDVITVIISTYRLYGPGRTVNVCCFRQYDGSDVIVS